MSAKRKSLLRIALLRNIVADVVEVPAEGQQPAQQGQQTPAQGQQSAQKANYSKDNLQSLLVKMPAIAKEVGTSNSSELITHLQNSGVDKSLAFKVIWEWAKNIAQTEKARKDQEVINEVAKRMGLQPADLSKQMQLPSLPGTKPASFRTRLLRTVVATDKRQNKQAGIMDALQKAMSYFKKAQKMTDEQRRKLFIKRFSDAQGNVTQESIANKLAEAMKGGPVTASTRTALKSNPFYHASILTLCTSLLLLTEAVAPESKDTNTLAYFISALSSFGISFITAEIWNYLKGKEEQQEKIERQKKNRLYQGEQF